MSGTLPRELTILDRSEVGKLAVSGRDAVAYLEAHLTIRVADLAVGRGRLGALLAPEGTLLGLVRVLRGPQSFHLDCDRAALDGVFRTLHHGRVGWDVELGRRTLELAELALRGIGSPLLGEHRHKVLRLHEIPVRAIGVRGGADLRLDRERGPVLLERLVAHGARVAGAEEWDVWRVEAGRPAFGVDVDADTLPHEAGLVPGVVDLGKGPYPGIHGVERHELRDPVHRRLRRLLLSASAPAGVEVCDDEGVLGRLSTAVVSPRLGPAALALLDARAEPGGTVLVAGAPAVVDSTAPAGRKRARAPLAGVATG